MILRGGGGICLWDSEILRKDLNIVKKITFSYSEMLYSYSDIIQYLSIVKKKESQWQLYETRLSVCWLFYVYLWMKRDVCFLIAWKSFQILKNWFYFGISDKGKKKKKNLVGLKVTIFSISVWLLNNKTIGTENCTWGTRGFAAFENIILSFQMQIWSWSTQWCFRSTGLSDRGFD